MTAAGKVYAGKLAEFMLRRYPPHRQQQQQQPSSPRAGGGGGGGGGGEDAEVGGDGEELVVWTSTMLRTGQTVAPMALHREVRKKGRTADIRGCREGAPCLVCCADGVMPGCRGSGKWCRVHANQSMSSREQGIPVLDFVCGTTSPPACSC